MNLLSYLKAHMHSKLLLVILTTLLGCFSTINSMELTKTQPLLLQKLSALSKDPEVRRVAKIVAIGAGVCAAALSLKKLLQSPEPATKPALMAVQPQPAQATASPAAMQPSSASVSVVEISNAQRAIDNMFDYHKNQYRNAKTVLPQQVARRAIFELMIFIDSVGVEGTGFKDTQSTNLEDFELVVSLAQKEQYAQAREILSKIMIDRARLIMQCNEKFWNIRNSVDLKPNDQVIRLKSFLMKHNGSR